MKHTSAGFSVLLVLVIATAISVAAISFVRTSGFLTSLALARQESEYQYWAAYGLMNYASATIRTQKDIPAEPIFLGSWPTEQSLYSGIIQAHIDGNQVNIVVQLLKGKSVLKELQHKKALEPDFLA